MSGDLRPARWADQVLSFWFEELERDDWFRVNSAVDETISARFSDLHDELSRLPVDALVRGSDDMLAAIIVLDQFPRNMFRGTAQAFASDGHALAVAREAIARGLDQKVSKERRVFVYLPFEHSEELADQERAVELVGTLGDEIFTRFAHAHRDVIARFGRFPHRNAALGRVSTAEEEAYLAEPGSGF